MTALASPPTAPSASPMSSCSRRARPSASTQTSTEIVGVAELVELRLDEVALRRPGASATASARSMRGRVAGGLHAPHLARCPPPRARRSRRAATRGSSTGRRTPAPRPERVGGAAQVLGRQRQPACPHRRACRRRALAGTPSCRRRRSASARRDRPGRPRPPRPPAARAWRPCPSPSTCAASSAS